jgi:uncharacterized protein DUF541
MARLVRMAVPAVIVLIAFPATASAQFAGPFGFPEQQEDYGPGITVSGVGFAPLAQRDRTTARAIGDARRRAEAIAAALGVSVAGLRSAEVSAPFDPRPDCGERTSRRCAPLDAVTIEATFSIAGGPDSPEGAREITGIGVGVAPVEAAQKTSPSIRRALRAARAAATPGAAEAASINAQAAATAAAVQLGPLFSVVEPSNLYGYEPLLGAFGPGRFCGIVRRARIRFDPETGTRRVVRRTRTRRCYKPRSAAVRLEATYLGG